MAAVHHSRQLRTSMQWRAGPGLAVSEVDDHAVVGGGQFGIGEPC